MDKGEMDLLIDIVADMLRQEVSDPLERMMDRLVAILLFTRALPLDEFALQMREALNELPESERDTSGAQLIAKYARLAELLPASPGPSPGSAATPEWFRGLIQGGKDRT